MNNTENVSGQPFTASHGSAITDTQRIEWLERNLMHISHDRATCSVDMSGRCVRGQLVNESRGANGGPSYFRVNHRSIREAIGAAMSWPNEKLTSSAPSGGATESKL